MPAYAGMTDLIDRGTMRLWSAGIAAVIAALAPACAPAQPPAHSSFANPSAPVAIQERCTADGIADTTSCYEAALLAVLEAEGVSGAMETLETLADTDPALQRHGHEYSHAIGLSAYETPATVGSTFAACTPIFQSGCYHGVIQAYFADPAGAAANGGVTAESAKALCADQRENSSSSWLLFQCVHGMGHGLTSLNNYDLEKALEGCDLLDAVWEQDACYGGIFMENIVQATAPHHALGRPETSDEPSLTEQMAMPGHDHSEMAMEMDGSATGVVTGLDPDDPHFPCSALPDRYLGACYEMQTSAMLFANGGDMAAAAAECGEAPSRVRHLCYQSLGRDISSYTAQSHSDALRLCALAPGNYEAWCHVGFAKNLVDLTADPSDALAYCSKVRPGRNKEACYRATGEEIGVLTSDAERRADLCAPAPAEYRPFCRTGAGLSALDLGV